MPAEQALREGKLDETLAQLQQDVRSDPANAKHRIFLFQLLVVHGEWERALTQLNVVTDLDPGALAMAQMYREAVRNELLRAQIFAGKRSPLVFGEPPEWIGWLIESLRLGAEGQLIAARDLRDRAFEAAPPSSGAIDGERFEWIADADPRLGPILEAIITGRYYWVPFQNIHEVVLDEPADLRDVVWMPAHFRWINGGETVGLIPTRYPGSETSDDEMIRMARKTEWVEHGEDLHTGLGQRMFGTDTGEYPLMNVRRLVLDTRDGVASSVQPAQVDMPA